MVPTFNDGDYLIVDEISYRFKNPERGEIIIVKSPHDGKTLIKRIVGIPGDTITKGTGSVTIRNADEMIQVLNEEAKAGKMTEIQNNRIVLSDSEYFVLGDNRTVSLDSRIFGAVTKKAVIGRPIFRLWPLSKIGAFPGASEAEAKAVGIENENTEEER